MLFSFSFSTNFKCIIRNSLKIAAQWWGRAKQRQLSWNSLLNGFDEFFFFVSFSFQSFFFVSFFCVNWIPSKIFRYMYPLRKFLILTPAHQYYSDMNAYSFINNNMICIFGGGGFWCCCCCCRRFWRNSISLRIFNGWNSQNRSIK